MQSAVEADLSQLNLLFALRKRFDPAIDATEIKDEIADRLREELDYKREAKHVALYREMLAERAAHPCAQGVAGSIDRAPAHPRLAEGDEDARAQEDPLEVRNRLATAMFTAWWFPFSRFGVIHGDPHLGNYTVFQEGGDAGRHQFARLRLHPHFSAELRRRGGRSLPGPAHGDDALVVHAYETWGFKRLSREIIDILNIWARFIYGPLLDDRVRTIADGVKPGEYGRKEAFRVHQALKQKGPVTVPREFVFMDRAAIGLGAVFLHLAAELNFYRLFNEAIERFSLEAVAARQAEALARRRARSDPAQGSGAPRRCPYGQLRYPTPPAIRDKDRRSFPMAEHGTVEYATAAGNDYPAHENSYRVFCTSHSPASSTSSTCCSASRSAA